MCFAETRNAFLSSSPLMLPSLVVVVVPDAYSHVPLNVVGNGHSDRKAEDGVGYSDRVDVAGAAEDLAGEPSGKEADDYEYRIGNVDKAEKPRAGKYGEAR